MSMSKKQAFVSGDRCQVLLIAAALLWPNFGHAQPNLLDALKSLIQGIQTAPNQQATRSLRSQEPFVDVDNKLKQCSSSSPYHLCWGEFTFSDGYTYVGMWAHDKRDGLGTSIAPGGVQYFGLWKDGRPERLIKFNSNGTVAESGLYDYTYKLLKYEKLEPVDLLAGKKQLTHETAKKITEQTALISRQCPRNVPSYQWTDCIGSVNYGKATYEGEYKDGVRSGKGTLSWNGGGVINSGIWSKDEFVGPTSTEQIAAPVTQTVETKEADVCAPDQVKVGDLIDVYIDNRPQIAKISKVIGRTGLFSSVTCTDNQFPILTKANLFLLPPIKFNGGADFSRLDLPEEVRKRGYQFAYANSKLDVGIRALSLPSIASKDIEKLYEAHRKNITSSFTSRPTISDPKFINIGPFAGIQYSATGMPNAVAMELGYLYTFVQLPNGILRFETWMRPENLEKYQGLPSELIWNIRFGETELATSRAIPANSQALSESIGKNDDAALESAEVSKSKELNEVETLRVAADQIKAEKVALENRLIEEAEQAKRKQAELEAQLAAVQQAQVKPVAPVGPALKVHAIVIGNGAYQGSGRLENPINDARAISAKLKGMGFKVTLVENADRNKLVSSLVKFSSSAADSDLTLFFYAGHGVQISGTNYMLPTDTNLNQIGGVPLHGISLNSVVEQFLPGKTKLVFLDACRDNPLLQVASRSVSRGLAPISVSQGTLISYATKDGSVAADGDGKNSPFTKALLQYIDDPDDIAVVLRKVRDQVMRDTGGQQQPWEYGSLSGGSLILSAIRAK
jgi:hypothetical protein